MLETKITLLNMNVYVSHDSACWYWRHASDFPRVLSSRCKGGWDDNLLEAPPSAKLLSAIKALGDNPIHLLVHNQHQRLRRSGICYHVCTKSLPSGSFCRIDEGVFVASPELALAQMAKSLSPFQFVDLSMEFMGTYALRNDRARGFATRQVPLVMPEGLFPPLEAILGKRSFNQIASVLKHAESGSRSPMETREFLLFFLPKRFGGYGLPRARMNARIELCPSEQRGTNRRHVECDLFWPEHNIAVEYDGAIDHASHEARMRDATKRNVLQARGIRQFTITARQILDARAFDAVVRNIANAMHFRLRHFPEDWEARRDTLRADLFKSMQING